MITKIRKGKRKSWSHKKYGKNFIGTYVYLKGERVMNLDNGKKTFTVESHQFAKSSGWVAKDIVIG